MMMTSLKQFGISARSLLQEPASHYQLLPETCELIGGLPHTTLVLYTCELECPHVPPLTLVLYLRLMSWTASTYHLKTVT